MQPPRQVVLTDQHGASLGFADIEVAHAGAGMLHKAFSVYLFLQGGRKLLVQQRSSQKRLWASVWANTCCSHPRGDERLAEAGERRLREELGISCPLEVVASFVYWAEDPQGRGAEYEHDSLLIGMLQHSVEPIVDVTEVQDWCWVDVVELQEEMRREPARFAPWFHQGLPMVLEHVQSAGRSVGEDSH